MDKSVSFYSWFEIRTKPGWVYEYHSHKHSELIMVIDGILCVEVDSENKPVYPGNFIILPVGKIHRSINYRSSSLHFQSMGWHGGYDLAHLQETSVISDENGRVLHQLRWMRDFSPQQQNHMPLLDSLTHTIVHEIGMLQEQAPTDFLARVCSYIRANLHRRISLDDLAEYTYMSKYHFARKFKSLSNQTPMQVVTEMRMDVAYNLIVRTDLVLQDIALQVGLVDASHLSRLFRRHFGYTPGSLRHHPRETWAIIHHDYSADKS